MLNEIIDVYDKETTAQYRRNFRNNPSKSLVVPHFKKIPRGIPKMNFPHDLIIECRKC